MFGKKSPLRSLTPKRPNRGPVSFAGGGFHLWKHPSRLEPVMSARGRRELRGLSNCGPLVRRGLWPCGRAAGHHPIVGAIAIFTA